jgi:hypothetical protein
MKWVSVVQNMRSIFSMSVYSAVGNYKPVSTKCYYTSILCYVLLRNIFYIRINGFSQHSKGVIYCTVLILISPFSNAEVEVRKETFLYRCILPFAD